VLPPIKNIWKVYNNFFCKKKTLNFLTASCKSTITEFKHQRLRKFRSSSDVRFPQILLLFEFHSTTAQIINRRFASQCLSNHRVLLFCPLLNSTKSVLDRKTVCNKNFYINRTGCSNNKYWI
jgi:hypothetical protein